ncbi:hypothetical protein B0O99DRAFT_529535 [Bisporella sp. PMI_857]|nr:hypothetical protein B0O99DRAFT_529535 [Bisporella sp. PMI_857]
MGRLLWRDPFWNGKRKPFVIAVVGSAVSLLLLFLGTMSYLYGSLYHDGSRVKALNILAVDLDEGIIGQSLSTAYAALQGDDFPTLHFHSRAEFATVDDIRHAVCKGDYWGAIFAQDGASTRLASALYGGDAASDYNASNTLTYVWNGVRYPTVQTGYIGANMETLIGAATGVYNAMNGTAAASTINTNDRNAVLALLNPITSSNINIMPTEQGSRVVYNSVSIVMPIVQQFFFLMALNGISNQFNVYGRLNSKRIGILRFFLSITYTFLASLSLVGYIWAFREDWGVNGNQFALSWMVMWLYMHVNFVVLDTATAFIPVSFLTFFVLTWVILNVTSTIMPFEFSPRFYRWGYTLPAHNAVSMLWQVWSGGCNNQLGRALPVLFAWEVFGTIAAIFGSMKRNRAAQKDLMSSQDESSVLTSGTDRMEQPKTRNGAGPGLPVPWADAIYMPDLARNRTL